MSSAKAPPWMSRGIVLVATLAMMACSGSTTPAATDSSEASAPAGGPIATVNGVALEQEQFHILLPEGINAIPEERARTLLLLLLHELFIAEAEDQFGVVADEAAIVAARRAREERLLTVVDDLDVALANRNMTRDRLQLDADLDALRDAVGAELVRSEADGFDIDEAYDGYLLDSATVCIRKMTIDDPDALLVAIERLDAGEEFVEVAREMTIDPRFTRPTGQSGSEGDYGCSVPNALLPELARAALEADVGEPFGPVTDAQGTHIILVYNRDQAALAEVRPDVLEHAIPIQGPDLFNAWAVDVLTAAEVTIDPYFGTWGPAEGTNGVPTVVPRDGVR